MKIRASFWIGMSLNVLFAMPTLAVQLIINEEDRNKDFSNQPVQIMGAIVNCNGARLDLRKFHGRITVNGNGNEIVLESCEALSIVGSGNSVDILNPTKTLLVRQSPNQVGEVQPLKNVIRKSE